MADGHPAGAGQRLEPIARPSRTPTPAESTGPVRPAAVPGGFQRVLPGVAGAEAGAAGGPHDDIGDAFGAGRSTPGCRSGRGGRSGRTSTRWARARGRPGPGPGADRPGRGVAAVGPVCGDLGPAEIAEQALVAVCLGDVFPARSAALPVRAAARAPMTVGGRWRRSPVGAHAGARLRPCGSCPGGLGRLQLQLVPAERDPAPVREGCRRPGGQWRLRRPGRVPIVGRPLGRSAGRRADQRPRLG
ncbi:hypothetical protein JYK04_01303 [Streptomyces nojiriensis]|nr:hypothetical protein JYK04_01303 [Streptomyces nojiriensis]